MARPFHRRVVRGALSLLSACALFPALAQAQSAGALSGTKQVLAITADGLRIPLGDVTFTPVGDGQGTVNFKLTLDSGVFTDHFLSMREFKCLPGGTELSCHVPYPYAHPKTVSASNLAWLEHSLLFFYKRPADFGAKLWNGIYFEFQATPTGWVGHPKAIDLNLIAAPPANTTVPPYRPALRDDMPPGARWLNRLSIE